MTSGHFSYVCLWLDVMGILCYYNYALANIPATVVTVAGFHSYSVFACLARGSEHGCVIQSSVGWRVCLQSGV